MRALFLNLYATVKLKVMCIGYNLYIITLMIEIDNKLCNEYKNMSFLYHNHTSIFFQCPFRTALDTVDSFLTRPNVNEDVTTLPPQSDITQTTIPYDNIPGPKGLPIVGTLFDYFKKDGPRFEKMFEVCLFMTIKQHLI